MTLSVRGAVGPERADGIKALFRRNGQPGFERVFDESYPVLSARSWVGEDDGRVVMHVALFPGTFGDGTRSWRGGLLGDLMADASHRNFFGPLQLLRRAVADAAASDIEFLYTDPTPASVGVVQAAGFGAFGTLRRHVCPTFWPWRAFAAARGARGFSVGSVRAFNDPEVQTAMGRIRTAGCVRARRSPAAYGVRFGNGGQWLWMEGPGSDQPSALALVLRLGDRLVIADLFADGGQASAAGVLLAAMRWAQAQGVNRVDLRTLEGSVVASAARRIGFVVRRDVQAILIRPLCGASLPPSQEWFLGSLDGSAW